MTASQPGLDCIAGRHLDVDIYDTTTAVGSWCLWCGTASYAADRITDDSQPVGFTPTYTVRIPDGFHRTPAAR